MNILVVDDEYYIVKNIIETTDWSALGIEQAFPAYSASQACCAACCNCHGEGES